MAMLHRILVFIAFFLPRVGHINTLLLGLNGWWENLMQSIINKNVLYYLGTSAVDLHTMSLE